MNRRDVLKSLILSPLGLLPVAASAGVRDKPPFSETSHWANTNDVMVHCKSGRSYRVPIEDSFKSRRCGKIRFREEDIIGRIETGKHSIACHIQIKRDRVTFIVWSDIYANDMCQLLPNMPHCIHKHDYDVIACSPLYMLKHESFRTEEVMAHKRFSQL